MKDNITAHGYNATITLNDKGINIKPGVVGDIFKGGSFLSEKFIPYTSITGIELTKGFPLLKEGSLQINTKGEIDPNIQNRNTEEAIDKNTVRFAFTLNKTFEEIANEIRQRVK